MVLVYPPSLQSMEYRFQQDSKASSKLKKCIKIQHLLLMEIVHLIPNYNSWKISLPTLCQVGKKPFYIRNFKTPFKDVCQNVTVVLLLCTVVAQHQQYRSLRRAPIRFSGILYFLTPLRQVRSNLTARPYDRIFFRFFSHIS